MTSFSTRRAVSTAIVMLLLLLLLSTSLSTSATSICHIPSNENFTCQNGTCHSFNINLDSTSSSSSINKNYSLCNCFHENTSLGYWQLDLTFLSSSSLKRENFTCSKCLPGFYGRRCQDTCPGIVDIETFCSGHGTCSDDVNGDGTCTCFSDSDNGYWNGTACDKCQDGFFGETCLGKCNCNSEHGICDEGRNGTGECSCTKSGSASSGVGGATCSECDEGYFDVFDNLTCSPCPTNPTTGIGCTSPTNGKCIANPYQIIYSSSSLTTPKTGLCYCSDGYTGTACQDSTSCPTCTCGGSTCKTCPNSCTSSSNGICNNQTGVCNCREGFSGADCSVSACPVGLGGKICSGNGVCHPSNGSCTCASSLSSGGFWNGTSCSVCHFDYQGSENDGCAIKCPTGYDPISNSSDVVCSGRGSCSSSGVCTCSSSSSYCGSACQTSSSSCSLCSNETWGLDCENNCTCQNGGTCNQGRSGNGSCTCPIGFVGTNCEISCVGSVVGVSVCSGHGTCSSSDGSCSCHQNYSLSDCSKHCETDNVSNGACSGHGVCDDGASGTGQCTKCFHRFVAPSTACANWCQCNELVQNSSRYGGTCNDDGTCQCDLRFTGANCDICSPGWSGELCDVPCVNGTTSSTTARSCACNSNFAGPSCDIQCPSSSSNPSDGCHRSEGKGTCFEGNQNNGTCLCSAGWGGRSCNCNISKCQELLGDHSNCDPSEEDVCTCDWNWATPASSSQTQQTTTTAAPFNPFTTSTSISAATTFAPTTSSENATTVTEPPSTTSTTTTTTTVTVPSTTTASSSSNSTSSSSRNQCTVCNASVAWGPNCEQRCACTAGQGECNLVTGDCICYSDRIRGFWSGALCRSCKEGYTGVKCDQPETPTLPLLPTISSIVPRDLNSKTPINEHIMKIYGVQKTSVGLRPFLPFGDYVSGILAITNKAGILTMTGESYEPTDNQQRLTLDVLTVCYPAFSIKQARGEDDPNRKARVEVGAMWVYDRRVFSLRRCLREYNYTYFNSTLNQNVTEIKYRRSSWGFASTPLLQTWTPLASTGYPPAAIISPRYDINHPTDDSAFPKEYENCSIAFDRNEEDETILSSPESLNSNRHSIFLRRFDNTPHFCMICQHRDQAGHHGATPKGSSTIFDERKKSMPKTLVCFQLHEFTDGRVHILMPESARVPLNETPVENVESMYYDEKIQRLVVFGSRSEGSCLAFAVNVARYQPIGKYDFIIFDSRNTINSYASENIPVRCKKITSSLPLLNSLHQVTNPNAEGEASGAEYLVAISFVSDSGVVPSSSSSSSSLNINEQARLLICNFSTFVPNTIRAVEEIQNRKRENSSFIPVESDWFYFARNISSTRYCIFPQSEPTGATDYSKITSMSYDPVLSMLFVSYGYYSATTSPPPLGNFSGSTLLKRFFIDTSKGLLPRNETENFVRIYSSDMNNDINNNKQNLNYLSPIRLDGVQQTRTKGTQGHSSSFAAVYARQLYLTEFGVDKILSRQLNIDRVSLIFIDSVKPQRVDARGGTELTITGRGFGVTYRRLAGDDSTRPLPKCRVGSVINQARLVSSTTAFCQTVQRNSDGCSTNEFVSLSMDQFAFAYSNQQIQRQETPTLKRLTPSSGRYLNPMQILVTGDNLVDFGFTRCLYIVLVKNGTAIPEGTFENHTVLGRANPANPSEIICDVAPTLSVPWNGQLDVSLDETVWTGAPLPVQFFGEPAGIRMQSPQIAITSAPTTNFPTLFVDIVDSVNQVVTSNVLPIPVFAEISVVNYTADSDAANPESSAPLHGTTGRIFELQKYVVNSPATISFNDLYLEFPPSGILHVSVRLRPTEQNSAINFDWRTTARVSVQPGTFQRISILRQPSEEIDSVGQLSQEPQISPVDAAGNNLNLNSFDGIILGVAVIERPLPEVLSLPSDVVSSFVPPVNRNQTVVCARGGCDLSALDPIQARAGYSYTYYIWEIARPSVFLETRVMLPVCSAGSFRPLGTYTCEVCIEHTTCDASGQMIVEPGYWRASAFALNVYQCFPEEACPGGNVSGACTEGYLGPRCSICEADRGKSVTDRCQPCTTLSRVTFVFSLIVLAVSIICFVIYVVQNWDDPDRHVTTLQLALTQCQLIVAMTDLEFDYPSWYRELQQWIALFSDLRIFESSNADCTLRPEGATFYTRFATYVCTPLVALVVAGLAWIILYLNPMFFRFNEKQKYEKAAQEENASEDPLLGNGMSDLKANTRETVTQRLRRRWKRQQRLEHKTEEDEIRVALKDLLAGSGDEDEDEIENERILAALHGAQPSRQMKNPPLPRTGVTFLMVTAQQVILFFMYPSTIQYSLSMQNCLEVEEPSTGKTISYLKIDPTISCDTTTYEAFRQTALVFGLSMLFGVPIIYIAAHYIHGRLRPTRRRERAQMFSFLMQGIRPRRWYYPAFIFLRKGFSTAIASSFTKPLDGYFTMWGLVFYLPMVYYLQPYLRWHHNALEALAVSATIVAINLSLIIYAIPDNATVRTACSALIVILLSCVLLVFAFISSAETRYILWGQIRVFFGHITESEDEHEFDNGPSADAARKAAEALDETPAHIKHQHAADSSLNATSTGKPQITFINEKKQQALANREKRISERNNDDGDHRPVTIEEIEGDDENADNFAIAVAEASKAVQMDKIKREKRAQLKLQLVAQGRFDDGPEDELEILDAAGPSSSMLKQRLLKSSSSSSPVSGHHRHHNQHHRADNKPSASASASFESTYHQQQQASPSARQVKEALLNDNWDEEYFKDEYAAAEEEKKKQQLETEAKSLSKITHHQSRRNNSYNSKKKNSIDGNSDIDDIESAISNESSTSSVFAPTSHHNRHQSSISPSGTAASSTSPQYRGPVPAIRKSVVDAEVEKAETEYEKRKVRLSHIGDNDEIIRFQRKKPEIIDFKMRDAKMKLELERRRERRRQAQEEATKKKLEESPYVYVPKQRGADDASAVDGLSPAQRLEILRSANIQMHDLVQRKEDDENNTKKRSPSSHHNDDDDDYNNPLHSQKRNDNDDEDDYHNHHHHSPIGRSTASPSVQQLSSDTRVPGSSSSSNNNNNNNIIVGRRRKTREEIEAEKMAERAQNAQKVLEKCFEPNFEVRTRNLEKYIASINKKEGK